MTRAIITGLHWIWRIGACAGALMLAGQGVCVAQPAQIDNSSFNAPASAPIWSGSREAEQRRQLAIEVLANAGNEGLDADDYRLSEPPPDNPAAAAACDQEFTDTVLRYARDLRLGRLEPDRTFADVELQEQEFDAAAALDAAIRAGRLSEFFASLAPPHPEYDRLRNALARYRQLAAQEGTPGDAVAPDTLKPSASSRVAQIIANMERWRWVPRDFGPTYIEVNSADTTLVAVDSGETKVDSRIIAGKPSTPTPIFDATVTGVTANPYWDIPPAIAEKEILPKTHGHPGYLASHHMYWDGSSGTLRQRPGNGNALGRVKLEMANRFNAYLHDTPTKKLFARSERHLSHGCMRTQKILPLASFALTGDADAGLRRVNSAIASGANQRLAVATPVPVYVLYWTAIAHEDGSVDFPDDVYGRDTALLAALAAQRSIGRPTQATACKIATSQVSVATPHAAINLSSVETDRAQSSK